MRVSDYPTGIANWADVGSPDVQRSARFYGELFGWDPRVSPTPEAGGYTIFHQGDAAVAGLGPLQGPDQPPAWTIYIATDNVDATAAKVEGAGGRVLMAPFDVMDQGRMAIFMDPSGAVFGAWQKITFPGAQLKDEPASLSWVELMTRDTDSCQQFYGAVFGWEPQVYPMNGEPYTVFQIGGGKSAAGMMAMSNGQFPADVPAHWMLYFEVDDVDATVAKIQELGGTVAMPPTSVPEVGRFATAVDPTGAYFSVISSESAPTAPA
ncbi:MAG: VOC family protein [Micromonosporaceae bacterium]|nr:VOC family protein [Micromonosporaceae bacterium]